MPSQEVASSSDSPAPACWANGARWPTAFWLRDSDIDLLARTGATVVHNCSPNLRLAAGVAPLRRLVAAGVNVALGLDDMGFADDDAWIEQVRRRIARHYQAPV